MHEFQIWIIYKTWCKKAFYKAVIDYLKPQLQSQSSYLCVKSSFSKLILFIISMLGGVSSERSMRCYHSRVIRAALIRLELTPVSKWQAKCSSNWSPSHIFICSWISVSPASKSSDWSWNSTLLWFISFSNILGTPSSFRLFYELPLYSRLNLKIPVWTETFVMVSVLCLGGPISQKPRRWCGLWPYRWSFIRVLKKTSHSARLLETIHLYSDDVPFRLYI